MKFRFFYCLLLAVVMSACGKDPKSMVDAPAAEPKVEFKNTDNVLRITMRQEPTSLNPVVTSQANARYVRELIHQTLTSQDPVTFEQVPQVASVADVRKEPGGGISYSYTIDDRAKWPNGLPITAADVIFSLKALMNPLVNSGAYRPYYYDVESIITSPNNERRFRVMTRKPYLLAEQSIGSLPVYPEYAYDPDRLLRNVRLGDLTNAKTAERISKTDKNLQAFAEGFNDVSVGTEPDKIVGSGPYRLVSWDAGRRLVLERRDDYWAADSRNAWMQGKPDQIIFDIMPDPQTVVTALRDEQVDLALNLSAGKFRELRDDPYLSARYDFATVPGMSYFGMLMNQQNPLFADAATRRAMAHLVDVDLLVEQIFPGGLARRVNGPVLEEKDYYADLPAIEFDPAKAAELLASAGWTDSNGDGTLDKEIGGARTEFSFPFMVFPSPESEAIGTLVSEWAGEVGVEITPTATPPRELYGALNKGDFAMGLMGYGLEPNPDEFTQIWASTSVPPNGSNRGGFNNAEADRLIKGIAVTLDERAREPMYQRFQEIIYENQPMVFLVSPATRLVVSKRFDYETTSLTPGMKFGAVIVE